MVKTLRDIAEIVGGEILGDGNPTIHGITNIDDADSTQITFAVPPHVDKAATCQAAAVIVPDDVKSFPKPAISVSNPRAAFVRLLELFTPAPSVERVVHPTAVIGRNVKLGKNVAVMPHVVIDDNVVIGDNAVLYPHVYVGQNVVIGDNVIFYANVSVYQQCKIGSRVVIHSGAVVGSDGFGFLTVDGRHHKVPQVGDVVIEDDVEIGANAAIDRATTGSTVVQRGTKIDNLVHLAHNVVIGENCFLVAQTGIAGSAKVGNNVTFAGQSGSAGHLTIGDNCVFAAKAGVISDVPTNSFFAGFPARPHKEWIKAQAGARRIPDLIKKVQTLEKKIAEIEKGK